MNSFTRVLGKLPPGRLSPGRLPPTLTLNKPLPYSREGTYWEALFRSPFTGVAPVFNVLFRNIDSAKHHFGGFSHYMLFVK